MNHFNETCGKDPLFGPESELVSESQRERMSSASHCVGKQVSHENEGQ
jgi:hypothetical protein